MNSMSLIRFVVKLWNDQRGNISLAGGDAGGGDGGNVPGDGGVPGEGGTGDGDNPPIEFEGVEFPDGLDKDVMYDPSVKPFIADKKLNYGNLLKSYVHAQRKMGEKGVVVPGKNATDEDWTTFYNNIRPSELDKYEVNPAKIEGKNVNEDTLKQFKEHSHKLGLMPKQAEDLFNWYNNKEHEALTSHQEELTQAYEKEVKDLKENWGEAFDQELAVAKRAFEEFADDDMVNYLKETKLDQNVQLIKLFNKVGKGLLSEDTFKQESKGTFGFTKEAADKKYKEIMGDSQGAYYDTSHPNHNNVVEEVNKLIQIAHA